MSNSTPCSAQAVRSARSGGAMPTSATNSRKILRKDGGGRTPALDRKTQPMRLAQPHDRDPAPAPPPCTACGGVAFRAAKYSFSAGKISFPAALSRSQKDTQLRQVRLPKFVIKRLCASPHLMLLTGPRQPHDHESLECLMNSQSCVSHSPTVLQSMLFFQCCVFTLMPTLPSSPQTGPDQTPAQHQSKRVQTSSRHTSMDSPNAVCATNNCSVGPR